MLAKNWLEKCDWMKFGPWSQRRERVLQEHLLEVKLALLEGLKVGLCCSLGNAEVKDWNSLIWG